MLTNLQTRERNAAAEECRRDAHATEMSYARAVDLIDDGDFDELNRRLEREGFNEFLAELEQMQAAEEQERLEMQEWEDQGYGEPDCDSCNGMGCCYCEPY
jgi:hypothetical protein